VIYTEDKRKSGFVSSDGIELVLGKLQEQGHYKHKRFIVLYTFNCFNFEFLVPFNSLWYCIWLPSFVFFLFTNSPKENCSL